jgi:hypothetical protein
MKADISAALIKCSCERKASYNPDSYEVSRFFHDFKNLRIILDEIPEEKLGSPFKTYGRIKSGYKSLD